MFLRDLLGSSSYSRSSLDIRGPIAANPAVSWSLSALYYVINTMIFPLTPCTFRAPARPRAHKVERSVVVLRTESVESRFHVYVTTYL